MMFRACTASCSSWDEASLWFTLTCSIQFGFLHWNTAIEPGRSTAQCCCLFIWTWCSWGAPSIGCGSFGETIRCRPRALSGELAEPSFESFIQLSFLGSCIGIVLVFFLLIFWIWIFLFLWWFMLGGNALLPPPLPGYDEWLSVKPKATSPCDSSEETCLPGGCKNFAEKTSYRIYCKGSPVFDVNL